jgi:hypothetical protein
MLLKPHQYLICIKRFFSTIPAARFVTLNVFLIYINTPLFAAESEGGGSPLMDFIWKAVNVNQKYIQSNNSSRRDCWKKLFNTV